MKLNSPTSRHQPSEGPFISLSDLVGARLADLGDPHPSQRIDLGREPAEKLGIESRAAAVERADEIVGVTKVFGPRLLHGCGC